VAPTASRIQDVRARWAGATSAVRQCFDKNKLGWLVPKITTVGMADGEPPRLRVLVRPGMIERAVRVADQDHRPSLPHAVQKSAEFAGDSGHILAAASGGERPMPPRS
jgi:hypothetical protein